MMFANSCDFFNMYALQNLNMIVNIYSYYVLNINFCTCCFQ